MQKLQLIICEYYDKKRGADNWGKGVVAVVCLYPTVECANQVKKFQAILETQNITNATIYFSNKLGIGIKEKDSCRVFELAARNRFDFDTRCESLTYRNGSFTKVRL